MTNVPPERLLLLAEEKKPYPSDVTDDEWALVAPYRTLLPEAAGQRRQPLREGVHALRSLVRTGAPWRLLPHDFPSWEVVYQQPQRWLTAGRFDALVHGWRALRRVLADRRAQPAAVILDSRTVQSTPESGAHAGQTAAGAKPQVVGDPLGPLLAAVVTAADVPDPAPVATLAGRVQAVTGQTIELAFVDQASSGAAAAAAAGIRLEVVKLAEAQQGFILLPRRWVVEQSFAGLARLRWLARDYERLPDTVAGLTFVAFACLLLHRAIHSLSS